MNETIVLCLTENLQSLLFGDVMSTLVSLYYIVSHITNSYTPSFRIICAAFLIGSTRTAARTWACCIFSFILVQPVRNVLYRYRVVLHLDSLLYRNDMHTDTGSAFRNHMSKSLQWKATHTFKETSHLRMFLQQLHIHIGKLCTSRNIHRKNPLFCVLWILVVPLDYAVVRKSV